MTSRASAEKLTYRDYLRFPEDGRRHELINGAHVVSPTPVTPHQRLAGELFVELHRYFEGHPIGEVFVSPIDVVLSDVDVLIPDLLVVLNDQTEIVTDKNVRGAPALVVEILSPGTKRRDLGIKRRIYDRYGVREYWVVDPEGASVTVHRPSADGILEPAAEFTSRGEATLTSPLLPGLAVSLATLFKN
jgi:Uma2 family endonuclease